MPDSTPIRPESWVQSQAEAAARQRAARTLRGTHVEGVRYVDIDYRHVERVGSQGGARHIRDSDEWSAPTWLFPECHSLDYGVELDIEDADGMAVTWQSPGRHEGLVLYQGVLADRAVRADANRAVWDVTSWGEWPHALASPITDIEVRYEPWDDPNDAGFWCRLISISFGSLAVRFLLGEGQRGSDEVAPSADNVAVLFPEHRLPAWAEPNVR